MWIDEGRQRRSAPQTLEGIHIRGFQEGAETQRECQKPGALHRELECLVAEASPPPLRSGISQADQPAKGRQAAPRF